MTICPKCQHQQLGGEECQACGLIFARYKGPQTDAIPSLRVDDGELAFDEPRRSTFRRVFRAVRWTWLVVSLIALFLMFLIPDAPAVQDDPQALGSAQEKIRTAIEAAKGRIPYSLTLNEAEINAILDFGMNNATGADREALSSVKEIKITISQNQLHLYFLVHRFGKDFALSLTGRPYLETGYFRMRAESGWVGYCPMLPFVLNFALDRAMSSDSQREQLKMPAAVQAIEMRHDELTIFYNSTGEEDEETGGSEMTAVMTPELVDRW